MTQRVVNNVFVTDAYAKHSKVTNIHKS